MMKTVRHNRKELKHIENSLKRNSVNKPVKVNNFLFMDNQERFENVYQGYSIQAERLLKVIQKNIAGKITKDWVTPDRKMNIDQSTVLLETIQFQLLKLKQASGKYQYPNYRDGSPVAAHRNEAYNKNNHVFYGRLIFGTVPYDKGGKS